MRFVARERDRDRRSASGSSSSPAVAAASAPRSPRSSAAQGAFVVTVDPLVSPRRRRAAPDAEETTAGRIVAAGGSARASSVSVTDARRGRAACSPSWSTSSAGSTRWSTSPASAGRPASPRATRTTGAPCSRVHLDGYLNVLGAALPIMAAAGHGRILGVTSGSGWRPADAGAYSCAKRAVAALTWQLGRAAPPGRDRQRHVADRRDPDGHRRARAAPAPADASGAPGSSATGGLSLGSMPQPEELGPIGAYLVERGLLVVQRPGDLRRRSEVAVVERAPAARGRAHRRRRVAGARARGGHRRRAGAGRGEPDEQRRQQPPVRPQRSTPPAAELPPPALRSCAVVTDAPRSTAGVTAALDARGVTVHARSTRRTTSPASRGAAGALASAASRASVRSTRSSSPCRVRDPSPACGRAAGSGCSPSTPASSSSIRTDAGWARAVADHAARTDRSVRLVTLTDATTAGGRSRAQAAAQLARAARGATGDGSPPSRSASRPTPQDGERSLGESWPTWCAAPTRAALSGAELVVGDGLVRPAQPPAPERQHHLRRARIPDWLDGALRGIVGRSARTASRDDDRARPASSTPTCTCGIRPAPTGTRTCRAGSSWTWVTSRACPAASTSPPTSPSRRAGTSRSS